MRLAVTWEMAGYVDGSFRLSTEDVAEMEAIVDFKQLKFFGKRVSKMITENTRKQLRDYKRHGKDLKYLVNYLIGVVDNKEIILREM